MNSIKYVIEGEIITTKEISESDVVGSIYSQTEGLLEDELDFNFLYKKGKIGRVEVKSIKKENKVITYFKIPTNLSKLDTSLIAASCESVDKVGNTQAQVKILKIEDKQFEKRKKIFSRAEELVKNIKNSFASPQEIKERIQNKVLFHNIVEYVKGEVFGGDKVLESNEIILVEGRADVINLIKAGFDNVLSFNGSNLSQSALELCKNKEVVLFLDGDKSGYEFATILKNKIKVNSICFAPKGVEVEELSKEEIFRCLDNKKNLQNKNSTRNLSSDKKEFVKTHFYKNEFEKIEELIPQLENESSFIVLSKGLKTIQSGLMSEILSTTLKSGHILVMNGLFESSMNKKLKETTFKVVVTKRKSKLKKFNIPVLTFKEFEEISEE